MDELSFDQMAIAKRTIESPTYQEDNQAYNIEVMETEIIALEGELDYTKDSLKAADDVVEKQTAVIDKQNLYITAIEMRLEIFARLIKAHDTNNKIGGWQSEAYLNDAQNAYNELNTKGNKS